MKPIFLLLAEGSILFTRSIAFRLGLVCFAAFPLASSQGLAQAYFEQTAPSKYRIEFTDKLNTPFSPEVPEDFLSQRAINRRQKQGIPVTQSDLPVNPDYIDSVMATGAKVLTVSKWFNAITIEASEEETLQRIARLSFVKKSFRRNLSPIMNHAVLKDLSGTQESAGSHDLPYGPSWWQTAIHNGQQLHNSGFTGKDIVIAVIDAGFSGVDALPAFAKLWENGQIEGTYDFVSPGPEVFHSHSHGMSVLSIIAGYLPDELIGTAPDASFLLLRSEDGYSEYLIEEDNWISAAEFADSAGVDIINTSLGYTEFNDSLQNHTYGQMDGNSTRISIAADMAVSKGILVVVSAGNQGNADWHYISAPADADSVLTIGAIDLEGSIAGFSSRGPSSDQQVKPNVVAIGQGTYVAGADGTVKTGNGTSYSAPVISGLTACLWQANPDASVMEVFRAICESANRYDHPDHDYGYGIPDFNLAHILLQVANQPDPATDPITVFPNPIDDHIFIIFNPPVNEQVDITLYDLTGKVVAQKSYPPMVERNYINMESGLHQVQKGAYIMRVKAGIIRENVKLIKL